MSCSFSQPLRLHERAVRSIAGGVNSGIRKLEEPVPVYFSHGHGARGWEIDGDDYRDYVTRHDATRWAHLRPCLLGDGIRAIERGLWFMSFAHTEADLKETRTRAARAFRQHALRGPAPV